MAAEGVQYPVDVLTVRLARRAPQGDIQNGDVAFIPVTRFNLRMDAGKNTKSTHLQRRHLIESPEYEAFWRHRIDIFERVCLPSMVNLNPRPDAWFIAFGEVDPPFLQEFLARLGEHSWLRPYFNKRNDPRSDKPLASLLVDHMHDLGKPFLCATRLDSDDSLQQQFLVALDRAITQIRERGFGQEKLSLTFLHGIAESDGVLTVHLRGSSMFQSIYAPHDKAEGPYQIRHDRIRERMPLFEVITNLPMWMYHRHDDVIDTPGAMPRDRMPLADPEAIYPLFGLDPNMASARQPLLSSGPNRAVEGFGGGIDFDRQRDALRHSENWSTDERVAAIKLATSLKQTETARWIAADLPASMNAAAIWRETGGGNQSILNAAVLGQLGDLLLDNGQVVDALLACDDAVELAPTDLDLRAARDALANSLQDELDFDEQLDLADLVPFERERSRTIAFIASFPMPDFEPAVRERLHERARRVAEAGFGAVVMTLSGPEESGGKARTAISLDGVMYESLVGSKSYPIGADSLRRFNIQLVAMRVAELQPSLLTTDGTRAAQVVAAAVGRAFALPVDFGCQLETVESAWRDQRADSR